MTSSVLSKPVAATLPDPASTTRRVVANDPLPLRTVLVDKDEIVRHGLIHILEREAGLTIVAHVGGDVDVASEVVDARATLVIIAPDFGADIHEGLLLADKLKATGPDVKLIVLSSALPDGAIVDAIRRGVDGVVSKSSPSDELLMVIRKVLAGEGALDQAGASAVVRALRANSSGKAPALTGR